jgi:phosphatidylglycerol:prolipoprotein diacylglycerol transferase
MQSELFRIPMHVGAVPLFGVGVLLVVWLVGMGGWLFAQRRCGMPVAEAWGYAPVVAMMAAAIFFLPRLFPDGLPIRGYGLMLLLAAVSGIGLALHRARQNNLPADLIYSLAFWMFLCGIAGARLFFIIEYWDARFAPLGFPESLRQMLMFTEGGLVVYGSLIGASLAFIVFCWKHKVPMLALADMLAPSLAIGLALGRVGCLLNGCCYGGVCDKPWAVTFPVGSPAYQDQLYAQTIGGISLREAPSRQGEDASETPRVILEGAAIEGRPGSNVVDTINGTVVRTLAEAQVALSRAYWSNQQVTLKLADGRGVSSPGRSLPVHPTQVYSAVNAALLALLTWTLYSFRRRDGVVIGLLLTLYPISRFLLEHIRTDEAAIFNTGLSISQNVSVLLLGGIVLYWFLLYRRPARLALPLRE